MSVFSELGNPASMEVLDAFQSPILHVKEYFKHHSSKTWEM